MQMWASPGADVADATKALAHLHDQPTTGCAASEKTPRCAPSCVRVLAPRMSVCVFLG